ncbi:AAEL009069-PA [Aedes aegypti]|uniref:AAEL009069-PA n=1 Tax=Aedes aegypti TaxID=7159 RepID=Q16WX4_AEDAE|nr:AAEL009069-PA [Aedes aegypti]
MFTSHLRKTECGEARRHTEQLTVLQPLNTDGVLIRAGQPIIASRLSDEVDDLRSV